MSFIGVLGEEFPSIGSRQLGVWAKLPIRGASDGGEKGKSANVSVGPFVTEVTVAGSGLVRAIKGVKNVPNGSVFALVGVADLEGLSLDGDGVAFEFHRFVWLT